MKPEIAQEPVIAPEPIAEKVPSSSRISNNQVLAGIMILIAVMLFVQSLEIQQLKGYVQGSLQGRSLSFNSAFATPSPVEVPVTSPAGSLPAQVGGC